VEIYREKHAIENGEEVERRKEEKNTTMK